MRIEGVNRFRNFGSRVLSSYGLVFFGGSGLYEFRVDRYHVSGV